MSFGLDILTPYTYLMMEVAAEVVKSHDHAQSNTHARSNRQASHYGASTARRNGTTVTLLHRDYSQKTNDKIPPGVQAEVN